MEPDHRVSPNIPGHSRSTRVREEVKASAYFDNTDRNSDPLVTADESYRSALESGAWSRLRPEVRTRFSVKPAAGGSIRYRGVMSRVELSLTGWLFAQVCRLIGTPLAPHCGKNVPMRILLEPDVVLDGIFWNRIYHFSPRKIFTVSSTKCKNADGSFTEHIGRGFSMRLKLGESNGRLVFTSTAYVVNLLGREYRLPDWITPGVTTVTHEQLAGEHFRFTLSVDHRLLGRTIYQDGEFYSDVSEV